MATNISGIQSSRVPLRLADRLLAAWLVAVCAWLIPAAAETRYGRAAAALVSISYVAAALGLASLALPDVWGEVMYRRRSSSQKAT
jgi:hypothetical protein